MGNAKGPEYKDGKPTRLTLALRKWGASSKADAGRKLQHLKGNEESMMAYGKSYGTKKSIMKMAGKKKPVKKK